MSFQLAHVFNTLYVIFTLIPIIFTMLIWPFFNESETARFIKHMHQMYLGYQQHFIDAKLRTVVLHVLYVLLQHELSISFLNLFYVLKIKIFIIKQSIRERSVLKVEIPRQERIAYKAKIIILLFYTK